MCTVTYLPTNPNGYVLTHSRDEKAIRPAAFAPQTRTIGGQTVTFPQDPQGQGTWIAVSEQRAVCLLNGAFVAHVAQPPYRHSRGLVVLNSFDYETIDAFIDHYNLVDIEPFTLLWTEFGRLTELRWNGHRLAIFDKDPRRPHIWSSVTLYPAAVIEQREAWFRQWQRQTPDWSPETIRDFHLSAGDGDPENAVLMNRNNQYFTVSLTRVRHQNHQTKLIYEDLTQAGIIQQTVQTDHAIV
jgi:hypothetical protein